MKFIFSSHAMSLTRHIKLLKHLISLYQSIHHLLGRGRVYIIVQLSVYQQQIPFQQMRIIYIGRTPVGFVHRIHHP